MILLTLLLIFYNILNANCSESGQRFFKSTMLFFSEPFLKGATLNGKALEGEDSIYVADIISDNIEDLKSEYGASSLEFKGLYDFGDSLRFGSRMNRFFLDDVHITPLEKQDIFLYELKRKKIAVIPSGWTGHAVAMIVKIGESEDKIDLTVVNTGEGVRYHAHTSDPNKIYPVLSRIWMEFKDIPMEIIFPSNAWFIQGFIMMEDEKFIKNLSKIAGRRGSEVKGSFYFYGTFLNNLRKYLIEPGEGGDDRVRPMQRSGSCAMESVMGALFYLSKTGERFAFYRVALGHSLMRNLFKVAWNDEDLMRTLTDGFHSEGRSYFKRLISSIAKQTLELLEEAFPAQFMHAGLIGEFRSNWLSENKDEAIKVLSDNANTSIYSLVLKSVGLCKEIFQFLEMNPIREESTVISSKIVENYESMEASFPYYNDEINFVEKGTLTPKCYLSSKDLIKLKTKIETFDQFYEELKKMHDSVFNTKYFTRILSVFKASPPDWWNLLRDGSIDELRNIQGYCHKLVKRFATRINAENTFDDIVLLGQLQILAWTSALGYNEKITDVSKRIPLGIFSPPSTLQSVLFKDEYGLLIRNLQTWQMNNIYDPTISTLFESFLEYSRSFDHLIPFSGPEKYCKPRENYFPFKSFQFNTELYEPMINKPKIEEILKELRKEKDGTDYRKWELLTDYDAKLLIVLSKGQEQLYDDFPHYYDLMATLANLRLAAIGPPATINSPFWTDSWSSNTTHIYLTSKSDISPSPKIGNSLKLSVIDDSSLKCENNSLFYTLRHSNAMIDGPAVIGFDDWYNYVRDAKSAIIFDQPKFQILTDHLLNIPKYDSQGNLDGPVLENAEKVARELLKLVEITLNWFSEKMVVLTEKDVHKLILRVTNVSILLTRFVSRIDFTAKLPGNKCSELLADLYNLILPFKEFKSAFNMDENEISHLNLVLAHICSTPIRNVRHFMTKLKLKIPDNILANLRRKTLERYYWFATKTSYIVEAGSPNISDYQFRYGVEEVPLNLNEAGALQELLKQFFLPSLVEDLSLLDIFSYSNDGQTVKITSSKDKSVQVLLNLLTGEIVKGGLLIVKGHRITNDELFRNVFKPNENPEALNGFTVAVGWRELYILSDFKGSSYIIDGKKNGDSITLSIRRKWKGFWYKFVSPSSEDNLCTFINHNWHEKVKFYSRLRNTIAKETLAFFGHDKDPFMRVTVNRRNQNMRIIIKNIKEDTDFRALDSRKVMLERNLKDFVDEKELNIAKDKDDNLMVFYANYRLAEDPMRPFTLYKGANSEIRVLNVANMTICADQVFMGKESLPGALMAVIDSKTFILLPRYDKYKVNEESYTPRLKKYITIEKIPVVKGSPTPQSRLHKLLLAYYLIIAHDYNSARELINPNHLHQNEPFNDEELELLECIVKIKIEAPEVLALKLAIFTHYCINQNKFPLSYLERRKSNGPNIATDEGGIDDVPKNIAIDYLFAVRELPEKYYIYRIVPEILNQNLFIKVFGMVENFTLPTKTEKAPEPTEDSFYDVLLTNSKYSPNTSGLYGGNIYYYLDADKSQLKELELASKLAVRYITKEGRATGTPLAIYCYAKNRAIWADFVRSSLVKENTYTTSDKLKIAMEKCESEFKEDFTPLNQSNYYKTKTQISDIWMTMKSDSKAAVVKQIESNSDLLIKNLVSRNDINRLKSFKETLEKMIKNDEGNQTKNPNAFDYFDADITSKVLEKLAESIDNFKAEKGENRLRQISFCNNASLSDQLRGLQFHFEVRINELESHKTELISELALMTSEGVDFNHSKVINSLNSLMHTRKTKSFASLYACYMRDSLNCIQRKFPQLNTDQCRKVLKDAKIFYSQKILIDYFGMLKKTADNFLSTTEAISTDDLTIFCDELSKIEDFNDRMNNPVIMNFEFQSEKYRLKPEQVEDVNLLATENQTTNSFPSVVIQRMMAAGKTLVLGTISVVKKALDSGKLSILVPPASLYQSNTTAMQTRTRQYFKKSGKTFSFPRFTIPNAGESPLLKEFLENVLEIIENTMNNRNYLILSPDSLNSFLNSYVEVLFAAQRNPKKNFNDLLTKYSQIYRIFKDSGSIILDEIDMTMDPRKELNFPTDENEPYNMFAVALLADFMEFLIFDEGIIGSGLKIHSNDQASFTPENFNKCLEKILTYIESELKDTSSMWYNYVFTIGKQKPDDYDSVMNFLRSPNMTSEEEWIRKFHENGNYLVADALIIVKAQLYQRLEDCLKGTVNQNYGSAGTLRPEIKYAVPYVAANTPSPSSVFADRWETLLKTLLMVSSSPCSLEIAIEVIEYVRQAIPTESAGIVPMRETPTYNHMSLILPIDPLALDSKNNLHVEMVREKLALRSPVAIRILFTFYINNVFENMTFPVEQITSNSLNMTSMFNSVQGYSGTIDNVNILPQKVIKYAQDDHFRNEKNNGGITLKLIHDSADGKVAELSAAAFSKSATKMVSDLLELYPKDVEKFSAIIDTGAFFKTFKNRQVAEAILNVCDKMKVVLYYDEDSNQLEYVGRSNDSFTRGYLETTDPDEITRITQVDLEHRFTFYDQRHITGSDILQPKDAHAIMTAGPRVLLRDILQGTLRMRQFMTSQTVTLVTTAASREFYSSKIKKNKDFMRVSDLLSLGALNEDDKQGQENDKLAFVKIDSEIRDFILDEVSRIILSGAKHEPANSLLNNMRSLFIRSIREVPLDWLNESKEQNSAEALRIFTETRLRQLKQAIPESETELTSKFDSLKQRILDMINPIRWEEPDCLLHYLRPTIKTKIGIEDGNEVQMQTLNLALVDLNLDTLIDASEKKKIEARNGEYILETLEKSDFGESDGSNRHWISLNVLYNDPRMEPRYHPLLRDTLLTSSGTVGVTLDLIKLVQVDDEKNNCPYPIFSKYTLEASHLLVQLSPDEHNFRVLLVSAAHAARNFDYLKRFTYNYRYWLCDLSGNVTATNDPETGLQDNILDFIPSIHEYVFDALIFNGSLPQILANESLKSIYYNRWLRDHKFTERARFLALRMRVLMHKDEMMFEAEDDDYVNLEKYARGDPGNSNLETICLSKGYPKKIITAEYKVDEDTNLVKNGSIDVDFDLIKELVVLYGQNAPLNNGISSDSESAYDEDEDEDDNPFILNKRSYLERKKPEFGLNSWDAADDINQDLQEIAVFERAPRAKITIS